MKISVLNCPTKISRKLVKKAINFYGSKLMSSQLLDNLIITINFLLSENKTKGKCCLINLREYKILIRPSISVKNILRVLAHEMVHVKQYATIELKDYTRPSGMIRFQEEFFKDIDEEDDDTYWDAPWEIDAHGREVGLYNRFIKLIG